AVKRPLHDVAPAGADSEIFPISRAWTTSHLHAGQFTAACGITHHQGYRLPQSFRQNFYVCDPTGNLVHRIVPDSETVLRTSIPTQTGVEFLASPDEWFRPVNLANGPDGALYVVDMYRAVVEHPRWVPIELKDRPDLLLGNDRGRIFRIVARTPAEFSEQYGRAVRVELKDAEQNLKTSLYAPWRADVTRRLLVEQQDREASHTLLQSALKPGRATPAPLSASHLAACLATAQGTGSLTDALLLDFFQLDNRLRQAAGSLLKQHNGDTAVLTAIRLTESSLSQNDQLLTAILRQLENSPQIRFQIALSLGARGADRKTLAALADIAIRDASSEPHRIAVLSSAGRSPVQLLELLWARIEQQRSWNQPGIRDFVRELTQVIGARKIEAEVQAVRQLIARSIALAPHLDMRSEEEAARRRFELVAFEGLASAGARTVLRLVHEPPSETADAMTILFGSAARMAVDGSLGEPIRLEALATLGSGYAQVEQQVATLKRIFADKSNTRLRRAALNGLARLQRDDLPKTLTGAWPLAGPGMRREILNVFLSSRPAAEGLVTEVLEKRIETADLTAAHRTRLLKVLDGRKRASIQEFFAETLPEDRREIVQRYQSSLKLKGDPLQGRQLFQKNCAVCHRIGKIGVNVAPDISDSRTKTPAQLLDSILDPNRAVDANYFGYSLITSTGRIFSGIISAETANSVTLKQAEGRTMTVLRSEIAELHNTGVSLMPTGQEKNITERQMADLISFIKNWRYLDGQTPLRTDP
ncbi:MAG: c-type cytochrome, partial [Planctomycetaceae bacterium]